MGLLKIRWLVPMCFVRVLPSKLVYEKGAASFPPVVPVDATGEARWTAWWTTIQLGGHGILGAAKTLVTHWR